jgi:catechol 2,3-dioxygenase-like lactoylglutathione lyase family enzyme
MPYRRRDGARALLFCRFENQTPKEWIMKRFHVHVSVDDLAANVQFYSTLFGMPPTVLKEDYAKWMVEDPRVNFAISKRGYKPGVDHLGVQVESEAELTALREQAAAAEIGVLDQKNTVCCYARSDKYWVTDPQSVAWETFHTLESVPVYGDGLRPGPASCCDFAPAVTSSSAKTGACCA